LNFINLEPYNISSIGNELNTKVIYTFRDTNITIGINNPPISMENVIVKLNSSLFEVFIEKSLIKVLSSSLIVIIPKFETFNVKVGVLFPFKCKLGVSFTNGLEFAEEEITITDKVARIFLFSVTPNIIHPDDQTIILKGTGFSDRIDCRYYDNATLIGTFKGKFDGSVLYCNISKLSTIPVLTVILANEYNDTSDSLKIDIYPKPIIESISSNSGLSLGNNYIDVVGKFKNVKTIYCKFDEFPCPKDCSFVNDNLIKCQVPSHPEGNSFLRISYNQITWISYNQTYEFIPCSIGYSASNYSAPCEKCPMGTYKPQAGLFDCFNCPAGTFSNTTGSSSCMKCHPFSSSKVEGLKSIHECFCDAGYYKNPKNKLECLPCPDGATCQFNTTIPVPKYGRWFSKEIGPIYYVCKPLEACGGFTEQNCTSGYYGPLCARCKPNYYKEKAFCVPCGTIEMVWLQFSIATVIIIGGLIIAGLFLLITSIKISHLASISIALSFWQIISIFG
jgi:hypothetical protein